jgi:hypothetical protein
MLEVFPIRDGKQRKKPLIKTDMLCVENYDYLYVGVSPKGQYGCNYWYIDEACSSAGYGRRNGRSRRSLG